jgi:hypothetical protein
MQQHILRKYVLALDKTLVKAMFDQVLQISEVRTAVANQHTGTQSFLHGNLST